MCEWCGHDHDVRALCAQRPKWSRRGFLLLAGSVLLGAQNVLHIRLKADSVADISDFIAPVTDGIDDYVLGVLRSETVTIPIHFSKDPHDLLDAYRLCLDLQKSKDSL